MTEMVDRFQQGLDELVQKGPGKVRHSVRTGRSPTGSARRRLGRLTLSFVLPQVQMTREDLVKVDQAQALGTKPDGQLAGEALVPRLVPEAPDIDQILDRIHDPVSPHHVTRVQIQLDPAVAVRGGRREDLDDEAGCAQNLLLADDRPPLVGHEQKVGLDPVAGSRELDQEWGAERFSASGVDEDPRQS